MRTIDDAILLAACIAWAFVMGLLALELYREAMKPIRAWRVRRGDRAFVREQQRAANTAMRARDNEQLMWRKSW